MALRAKEGRLAGAPLTLAALLAASCGSGGARLSVDVRTDLAPGAEFSGVHTMLDTQGVDHLPVASENWLRGARVAELAGLAFGAHTLDVSVLSGTTTVATRRVDVMLSGDLAVTVVIPRSCAGVVCPRAGDAASATTCVDGRCASPACGTPGGPACPGCTSDTECAPSAIACAPTRCSAGTCLRAPDDGLCAAGLACDVAAGCVAHTDGGRSLDAGTDADVDAGTDAGSDAGPPAAWDGGVLRSCAPCLTDSDCLPPESLCFRDPHDTTENDCFQVGIGSCPTTIYSYGIKSTSVGGTFGMACVPVTTCSALRAFGEPCGGGPTPCGVDGVCNGTTATCTYPCSAGHDCLAGRCDMSMSLCE